MTLEHDVTTSEDFGLAGTFPRPGWVVLDAARDRRFTGEVVFETVPRVRVYLDRGSIYLAERVTDPSLGARLVDSGALNAAQLEHGSMRVGDDEHLGRLFERAPSVDRHAVLVTAELMTEECVGWLAHQRVDHIEAVPYRHHPSGVHRWDRSSGWSELNPGDPLPAPGPGQVPVEVVSPEPLFEFEGEFTDDMITWDEPSWLDERSSARRADLQVAPTPPDAVAQPPTVGAPAVGAVPDAPPVPSDPGAIDAALHLGDWIDRLESDGLPETGSDPLAAPTTLPPLPVEPADRFEVIWPSGEVDEQFGGTDVATVADHHPDLDRAGPTARVARAAAAPAEEPEPDVAPPVEPEPEPVEEPMTDEVVLAVRRAVASIETGAMPPRHAPEVDRSSDDVAPGDAALASRTSVRRDGLEWAQGVAPPPVRSVFDDLPVESPLARSLPAMEPQDEVEPTIPAVEPSEEPERTSALRRLIGSLRRR